MGPKTESQVEHGKICWTKYPILIKSVSYLQEGGSQQTSMITSPFTVTDKIDYRNILHMCQIDGWLVHINSNAPCNKPKFHGVDSNKNYLGKTFIAMKVCFGDDEVLA